MDIKDRLREINKMMTKEDKVPVPLCRFIYRFNYQKILEIIQGHPLHLFCAQHTDRLVSE